jgi:Ser/Thr protein kinase RdoA (MazF antagonist)
VLTVVPTNDGASFYKDPAGEYWRAYLFIENGKTCDTPDSPAVVGETARMFGQFLSMLADMPGPPLNETIKDFHNGPKRLLAFQKAAEADSHNRARDAKSEIEFILNHSDTFVVLANLADKGGIPVRVTHNDTKINNVIFDCTTGQGLCIIDLDTVMPGLSLYDFGDMVRTATCPAAEDERDLSKVALDLGLFEALLHFLRGTESLLSPAEIQHLPFAGRYITLEQAMRFLTDYLQGDVYYKVHRDGHNLDRCRTQLKLVQSMLEQDGPMHSLLEKV